MLLDILNCKDPPVWEKVTNKSLVMAAAEGLFWNFKVQFDFIFMADFISRLFLNLNIAFEIEVKHPLKSSLVFSSKFHN